MEKKTALKILKELHDKSLFAERTALETLIPELKESEDEKIRKSLIDMLKNDEKCYLKEIAWLKKQGENKFAWKPSDEQMEALNAINVTGDISYAGQGQELINLYNELKKLREE